MSKKNGTPKTEQVHASELFDVFLRIAELKDSEFRKERRAHRPALAAYEKKRGGRPEVEGKVKDGMGTRTAIGFYSGIGEDGQPVFVPRPREPRRLAYLYRGYSRDYFFGENVTHAHAIGILADPVFNRETGRSG